MHKEIDENVSEKKSNKKIVALFAGPSTGALLFALLPGSLNIDARVTAGLAGIMAVWFVTEAIPLPVTALLPLVVFPFSGVADAGAAAEPYSDSVILLVLGGIMLGLGAQRWNLHQRIALLSVRLSGTKPSQIIFGLMAASAFVSMWVSSTATAIIMIPTGVAVLSLIQSANEAKFTPKLTSSMILGIAYAISIGSMATVIGNPPNGLARAYLEDSHGIVVGFAQWMVMGAPFALIMLVIAWFVLTKVVFRSELTSFPGEKQKIESELDNLGKVTTAERRVLCIFAIAIFFWVAVPLIAAIPAVGAHFPWLSNFDDTSIAVGAAVLMFLTPAGRRGDGMLLNWDCAKDVPWGLLLLFGGGLSLSAQFTNSGLSEWIGTSVAPLANVSTLALLIAVVLIVLLLTELTSNMATAATFFPIMGAVAIGAGIDPLFMTMAVAYAVTCAYMLPAATPPNAIAFASGQIQVQQMVRGGVILTVLTAPVIIILLYTVLPLAFDVNVG